MTVRIISRDISVEHVFQGPVVAQFDIDALADLEGLVIEGRLSRSLFNEYAVLHDLRREARGIHAFGRHGTYDRTFIDRTFGKGYLCRTDEFLVRLRDAYLLYLGELHAVFDDDGILRVGVAYGDTAREDVQRIQIHRRLILSSEEGSTTSAPIFVHFIHLFVCLRVSSTFSASAVRTSMASDGSTATHCSL